MRPRLIPREERFFDLFVEDAANVLDAAHHLVSMLRTYDDPERGARALFDLEHRGDELSHDIFRKLNRTFVTPFDREDIVGLVSGLDDILDHIEEIGDTFVLYRIESPTPTSIEQAEIIVRQVSAVHEALAKLRTFKGIEPHLIDIHRLENEGDRLTRAAVASLFADSIDPVHIIKWKHVYRLLEACIDKCEDVADTIEKIVLKHA